MKKINYSKCTIIESQDKISRFLEDPEFRKEFTGGESKDATTTIQDEDGRSVCERSIQLKMHEEKPSNKQLRSLLQKRDQLAIDDDEELAHRTLQLWISDERVDRHGDIVEQSWNFKDYAQNPIILFGHNWWDLPIGASLSETVLDRSESDYEGKALQQILLFASEDTYDEAGLVNRMVKARMLRTASVGFYPGKIIRVDDEDERKKLGLGRHGVIYQNNNLIENSIVPVPANKGATVIQNAAKRGLLLPKDIMGIRETYRKNALNTKNKNVFKENDDKLCGLWRSLFPNVTFNKEADLETPFDLSKVESKAGGTGGEQQPKPKQSENAGDEEKTKNANGSPETLDAQTQVKNLQEVPEQIDELRKQIQSLQDSTGKLLTAVDSLTDDSESSKKTQSSGLASILSSALADTDD